MKILIYIGLAGFYLHYYFMLVLITLCNAFKFIFNLFTHKQAEKHKISPFEIAHKDVFTSLCTLSSKQTNSFRTKVSSSKSLIFKLLTRFQLRCGVYKKKISNWPFPILFYWCMVFWTAPYHGFFKLTSIT